MDQHLGSPKPHGGGTVTTGTDDLAGVGLFDECVIAHIAHAPVDAATSGTASPPYCVLLGERDATGRSAIRTVLEADGRFSPCSEAADAPAVLSLALRRQPHLCLLDVDLPGGSLDAAREIAARLPSIRIVFRTQAYERAELVACLQAGACGYLSKGEDSARLPEVLARVLAGEAAIPRALVGWLTDGFKGAVLLRRSIAAGTAAAPLSSREWEIFDRLCQRRTTAEIAEELNLSKATVRSHVAAVVHKVGVRDRAELIERFGRPGSTG